jgi:pimeloyl-ACP methyl ester carboxylesterase
MTEIVFVHGALVRDGAWWWNPVAELLREHAGVHSRAVALPSCGEGGMEVGTAGLAEDAAALRDVLDEAADAIVVAHSYGGTVVAEAGAHPAVRHLALITSYLPDIGMSQAAVMEGETDPVALAPHEGGALQVDGDDPEAFGARFWHDVDDPSLRRGAWDRVAPQSAAALLTPTTEAGWMSVPSTYYVCTDDRSTSVGLQRVHAARATTSVDLPTGHHPFLSRPALLADHLERLLR